MAMLKEEFVCLGVCECACVQSGGIWMNVFRFLSCLRVTSTALKRSRLTLERERQLSNRGRERYQ